MSHANGAVPLQPVAVISIALFPDENVMANVQGQITEHRIRGMCGTAERLLVELLQKKMAEVKGGGIEEAPPDFTRKLLGG